MKRTHVVLATLLLLTGLTLAAPERPGGFPDDVPLMDTMVKSMFMKVRDDIQATYHVPKSSVGEIAGWYKREMAREGWTSGSESISAKSAILVFTKDGRSCGLSITDFVMGMDGSLDRETRGVTFKIDAAKARSKGQAASSSGAAGGG